MNNPKEANPTETVTVDGCDYTVEIGAGGDVLWVYNQAGDKVADAEHDHSDEALHAAYFDQDGLIEGYCARQPDLFKKPVAEVVAWLISTHPLN